jgi:hydroxymethylpyrimidine kinase/phosphomethylpyrimidine kinase
MLGASDAKSLQITHKANILLLSNANPLQTEGNQRDIQACIDLEAIPFSIITCFLHHKKKETLLSPVKEELLNLQLYSVLNDTRIDAVKIGALANKENAKIIFHALKLNSLPKIVLDPVFFYHNTALLEKKAHTFFFSQFLPLAEMITPNISEAEKLTGSKINTLSEVYKTAEKLYRMGSRNVLIKGGALSGSTCVDILFDGKQFYTYEGTRHKNGKLPGSGSLLSSAIAVGLSRKLAPNQAVLKAREYLQDLWDKSRA